MGLWKIDLVKLAWYHFYEIISLVEKGNSTDVMYLDFCKAFDLVPPDILIKKWECYKIIAANIKWIKKQLIGTSRCAIVNGIASLSRCVSIGVLQRKVLDAKLFNIPNHVLKKKKKKSCLYR